MSKILRENKHFIYLLLRNNKEQARAILYTLSKEQVLVIAEILFNLNHIPLNKSKKIIILKKKNIFNKIVDKRTAWGQKRNIIEKHYKSILGLLLMVKSVIIEILK